MTALNKQALIAKIKKQTESFDTVVLKEDEANLLLNELEAAEKRIAELEARAITLPQRLQPGADGYDDWYVHSADDGEYLKVDDVIAAIRAAGIGVKGE
ncbi:Uncharacterised protein [Citrobacter youngae]|uniref:Ead/Ea22-like family protein n=2 Tax=Citrobacter youngae TaxID=133448 RepID=A0A9Q7ZSG3_9ENTR|nr:Uncharacterised protein [Citrobacter youngae]